MVVPYRASAFVKEVSQGDLTVRYIGRHSCTMGGEVSRVAHCETNRFVKSLRGRQAHTTRRVE